MNGTENLLAQIESQIVKVKLRDLKLLEKNARYMTPQEFSQLVANIKQDGKLMGVPVVYRGEVLSGNHRVRAAIKAAWRSSCRRTRSTARTTRTFWRSSTRA